MTDDQFVNALCKGKRVILLKGGTKNGFQVRV